MSQFAGFTVDNGAIKDLRELLFATLYKDPDLNITNAGNRGYQRSKTGLHRPYG